MKQMDRMSAVPLSQQIKDVVRVKIESGEYAIGKKIPTIAEFCVQYQVSTITVRRAISDLVTEGILKGIPGKGTFVISSKKKRGERGNRIIGVIFPNFVKNPFFTEIFSGIENTLGIFGYHPIVKISNSSPDTEKRVLSELKDKGVEGIILVPTAFNQKTSEDPFLRQLFEEGPPIVFLDRMIPGFPINYVASNNKSGGYDATHYLLSLRHRRIGFISDIDVTTVRERLAGYQTALADFNILYDPLLIKRGYTENPYEKSGYRNAIDLLHLKNPPTAIFACNDEIALGVYQACHQFSLKVPEDLSIIGYDNLIFSASLNPPLTTIHQPKHEMGQKAAELLLRRIGGEKNAAPEQIILENHLIERNSCSVPKDKLVIHNNLMSVKKGG